ncbi:MAG TPA: hypothetical protein DDY13_08925 [Cytophagales bacterium]|jgi:glycosyltransferase involved in cell wall biosynthesis|nr:hypothetical protein [Cytophagales bacterium]
MKVSIIIAGVNPQFIQIILDSLLNQSLQPFEVIISEDGVKPEMEKLIEAYQLKVKFRLIHLSEPHQGFRISYIRNKAAAIAKGDFFIFSDGDLFLHKRFVEDYTKAMDKGVAFIGTRSFVEKSYTSKILSGKKAPNSVPITRLEKNTINAIRIPGVHKFLPSISYPEDKRGGLISVHREDFFAINGYNEAFKGWGREDTDFVCRLFYHRVEIRKLKFAGLTYHLWHPIESREYLNKNDSILQDTIKNRLVFCELGVSGHLNK